MNWSGMVVFSCSSAVHLCIHPTIAIYRSGINSATWLCCGCSSTHRWLTTVQPPTGTTFRKLFPQQEWLVSIHCFIDSPPFTPRRCITWAWREEQKFSWGPPGCCVLYGTYHHIYIYPPIKARKWHMDIQGIMNKAWELQVPGHQTLLSIEWRSEMGMRSGETGREPGRRAGASSPQGRREGRAVAAKAVAAPMAATGGWLSPPATSTALLCSSLPPSLVVMKLVPPPMARVGSRLPLGSHVCCEDWGSCCSMC